MLTAITWWLISNSNYDLLSKNWSFICGTIVFMGVLIGSMACIDIKLAWWFLTA